jgi:hypothetical protein
MTKWEYMTEEGRNATFTEVAPMSEERLNYLGAKGWELVAITEDFEYVFKRPLEGVVVER